ncbi:hypothetical protein [Mesorhizobium helmanticense]|uniref:hypothetical protein n=1 Tax=Mesorhizobium helmanticense TaxID=1776423 RepID=UPI001FE13B00|nr:hypothetical protein [Mesorhizobium helmanticense]
MSKSVAVITGACQGIGHGTAIRLARDFSARRTLDDRLDAAHGWRRGEIDLKRGTWRMNK